MESLKLDWTETEYAALLLASSHGGPSPRALPVLEKLGKELTMLSQQMLTAAETYFRHFSCLPLQKMTLQIFKVSEAKCKKLKPFGQFKCLNFREIAFASFQNQSSHRSAVCAP